MFFRSSKSAPEAPPEASALLIETVKRHMPDADPDVVAIVGAVAGLLARVAYADLELSESELDEIRHQLGNVEGFEKPGIEAVCELVREHSQALGVEGIQTYTRVLYDETSRALRIEVLDVLLDLAAADGRVTLDETNLLRRITTSLGLSDADYQVSQERYRKKLSVLETD
jgi:uncharacterized tellurite resistance protein B-like protein